MLIINCYWRKKGSSLNLCDIYVLFKKYSINGYKKYLNQWLNKLKIMRYNNNLELNLEMTLKEQVILKKNLDQFSMTVRRKQYILLHLLKLLSKRCYTGTKRFPCHCLLFWIYMKLNSLTCPHFQFFFTTSPLLFVCNAVDVRFTDFCNKWLVLWKRERHVKMRKTNRGQRTWSLSSM